MKMDDTALTLRSLFFCIGLAVFGTASFPALAAPPNQSPKPFENLTLEEPATVQRTTDLAEGGYILIPEQKGYAALAEDLKAALAQRDASFEITRSLETIRDDPANVIALGQMLNNPLLERLYWNFYVHTDSVYPGKQAFVVKTIHQPLPVLAEHNVLVLGGSSLDQTRKAASYFTKQIQGGKDLALDPLLEVHGKDYLTRQVMLAKQGLLYIGTHTTKQGRLKRFADEKDLQSFASLVQFFQMTGDRDYLEAGFDLLDRHLQDERRRNDGDYQKRLGWRAQRDSYRAITAWDAVLPHLQISDQRRLKYERYWAHFASRLPMRTVRYKNGHLRVNPGNTITYDHTVRPLLGLYLYARYFKYRYDMEAMQHYIDIADDIFMLQAKSYLSLTDDPYYVCANMRGTLYYYLMANRMAYFKNGNAKKLLNFLLAYTNNQGITTAAGSLDRVNTGMASRWICLRILEWYLKDPGIKFMVDDLLDDSLRWSYHSPFYPELKPAPPKRLLGLFKVPMSRAYYDYLDREMLRKRWLRPVRPPQFPYDQSYQFLQYRGSFDPKADYMFTSGQGWSIHSNHDANAIIVYSGGGYKFLADGAGRDRRPVAHTRLAVTRDGLTERLFYGISGLVTKAEFNTDSDRSVFTRTRLKDLNGIDWDRNIYWHNDDYFLVVDTVEAQEQAEFAFLNTWRLFNRGRKRMSFDGHDLTATAPGQNERIDPAPKGKATFHLRSANPQAGTLVPGLSISEIPIYRMKQSRKRAMNAGDRLSFQNLFYVERPDEQGRVTQHKPERIARNVLMIHNTTKRGQSPSQTLVLLYNASHQGYRLDGEFASIGQDEQFLVDTKRLTTNGKRFWQSSVPVSARVQGKTLTVKADQAGRGQLQLAGQMFQFEFDRGTSRISLPAGVHIDLDTAKLKESTSGPAPSDGGASESQAQQQAPQWKPDWQTTDSDRPVGSAHQLASGDIDGDGTSELLQAVGNQLIARELDGKKLWTFDNDSGVWSVAAGNLDDDKAQEIVIGTGDAYLRILDGNGKQINKIQFKQRRSGHYGMRNEPNRAVDLAIGDVTGDGKSEIVSTTDAFHAYVHDADLNELYYFPVLERGGSTVQIADLAPRDKAKRILATNQRREYYVLDWRDDDPLVPEAERWPVAPPLQADETGRLSVRVGQVDGQPMLFATSGNGILEATRYDPAKQTFNQVWTFGDVVGFGFTPGALATLSQAHPKLVLTGGETNYVYAFNAKTGDIQWKTYVNAGVSALASADGQAFAGTEGGAIYRLSAKGKVLAKASLPSVIVSLKVINDHTLAAMDTYGNVAILKK